MEEDKKLLEEIEVFEAARDAKTLEERNEKNQRLFWMQDVLKMQKIEEAKRHKEIETLFSEEAEKMWKKQEAVWRRENEARKHLMEDVLAGLKTVNFKPCWDLLCAKFETKAHNTLLISMCLEYKRVDY